MSMREFTGILEQKYGDVAFLYIHWKGDSAKPGIENLLREGSVERMSLSPYFKNVEIGRCPEHLETSNSVVL